MVYPDIINSSRLHAVVTTQNRNAVMVIRNAVQQNNVVNDAACDSASHGVASHAASRTLKIARCSSSLPLPLPATYIYQDQRFKGETRDEFLGETRPVDRWTRDVYGRLTTLSANDYHPARACLAACAPIRDTRNSRRSKGCFCEDEFGERSKCRLDLKCKVNAAASLPDEAGGKRSGKATNACIGPSFSILFAADRRGSYRRYDYDSGAIPSAIAGVRRGA